MKCLVLLICCAAAVAGDITWENSPIVTSPLGSYGGTTIVSGNGNTINAFTKIPYAVAPTGANIFQAASPPQPFEGVYDATKKAPAPALPFGEGQEIAIDCLYLNIYQPSSLGESTGLLPIVVYFTSLEYTEPFGTIAGLGYHYSSGQNFILVTVNYRGGVLGSFATGDSYAPGNAGLKDQLAALKFVKLYGEYFGGDINKVIIAGDGYGAASIPFHLASPASAGYFNAAVILSGAFPTYYNLPSDNKQIAIKYAEHVNCPIDFSASTYECLGKLSAAQIAAAHNYLVEIYGPAALFAPVIESASNAGAYLTAQLKQTFASGNFNKVPVMIGSGKYGNSNLAYAAEVQAQSGNTTLYDSFNSNWSQFAPKFLNYGSYHANPEQVSEGLKNYYMPGPFAAGSYASFSNLIADLTSFYPNHKLFELYSSHAATYQYIFNYERSTPYKTFSNGSSAGVYNEDLIALLFHTSKYPEHSARDAEYANALWGYVLNLLNGSPTPGGKWLASSPSAPHYLEYFGDFALLNSGYYHQESMQKLDEFFASSSSWKY